MAQYYSSEAMAWLKMANRWPNTEAPMNELASCIASTQNITHTLYQYFAVPPRVHMDSTGLHWTPVDSTQNLCFGKDYLWYESRVRVRLGLG